MEAEVIPRPRGLLITSAILAAFTLYAAIRSGDLMGRFRELYEGFGAEVPPLTRFVLASPNFWWLITIPSVAVCAWIASRQEVTRRQKRRMQFSVICILLLGAALYALAMYALYQPIFALGNAI
jgi:type II secretory pathway component PulF